MQTIQLDDAFLQEIGLENLSEEGRKAFLQDALEMLQLNIGVRLSEDLTEEQMGELESKLTPEDSDTPEVTTQKQEAVGEWLRSNHPHYNEIVSEEIQKLKQTLRDTVRTDN